MLPKENIHTTPHTGIVLCMGPANETWRYNVTSSLVGCVHTQNDPCTHLVSTYSDLHTQTRMKWPPSKITIWLVISSGYWWKLTFLQSSTRAWGQIMNSNNDFFNSFRTICFSKLNIIGSDNGLSPRRCQAIIWTSAGILLIGPWFAYANMDEITSIQDNNLIGNL